MRRVADARALRDGGDGLVGAGQVHGAPVRCTPADCEDPNTQCEITADLTTTMHPENPCGTTSATTQDLGTPCGLESAVCFSATGQSLGFMIFACFDGP